VDASRQIPGLLGSRMTGAGFGGCTVSILHKDQIEIFMKEAGKRYTEMTGLVPSFYAGEVSNGVTALQYP
ncbi:MAG TPA: galactokinase, partial [Bacteroidales bacterium]|nr:galactokinase [Bacteroidales bacterium]